MHSERLIDSSYTILINEFPHVWFWKSGNEYTIILTAYISSISSFQILSKQVRVFIVINIVHVQQCKIENVATEGKNSSVFHLSIPVYRPIINTVPNKWSSIKLHLDGPTVSSFWISAKMNFIALATCSDLLLVPQTKYIAYSKKGIK